ncbi:ComEC/Rec2 family competence protein [Alteromonas sp. KUL106]|uniref:ComEC/Rec2 family competence protein n=1 Tax=Alteromonas sp. KUL106 TaxID=2480799 RepID=UPI0012E6DE5A|nr:MBL fold metallo-hydrolase [Alteromonas sp. KUL106]GFD70371.1 hypothetical protein KUL106_36340 [Alteromonas sp. KUL106]
MTEPLQISMLPAKEGDCLLIEYGEKNNRKYVLIDGGRAWTYRNALKQTLEEKKIKQLELLVVTHVDRDHIDGVQEMLQDQDLNLLVKEVWFNTFAHLNDEIVSRPQKNELESFSVKMGESFSRSILLKGWPWNEKFGGSAVKFENAPDPISISGLNIQLLSPDSEKLTAMKNTWELECKKAGLKPGFGVEENNTRDENVEAFATLDVKSLADTPFEPDKTIPNGSSIAFILEYCGKRVLFGGDAHVDLLIASLTSIGARKDSPFKLDAIKIPHHASKGNVSKDLLDLIECKRFLISSNGNYFEHPSDIAIARIIKFSEPGLTFYFNYKTKYNKHWEKAYYRDKYKYSVVFPTQVKNGYLTITL